MLPPPPMRGISILLGGILSLLAAEAAWAAEPGALERARVLVPSADTEHIDDGSLEGAELKPLLADEGVRQWLRNEILRHLADDEQDPAESFFRLLIAGGVTLEEVKLLELVESQYGSKLGWTGSPLYLGPWFERLLARAPFSLNAAIEEKILPLSSRRAAESLASEEARALRLLAVRIPPASVRQALAGAWKKAATLVEKRVQARRKEATFAIGEIALLPPEGTTLSETFYVHRMGNWTPSDAIIWPDGKVRFLWGFTAPETEASLPFTLVVPGYYDPPEQPLDLMAHKVAALAMKLEKRRSVVAGTISPKPVRPLFATVSPRLPLGGPAPDRRFSEFVGLVRPDGAFAVPYTRRFGGKHFLVYDADGNLLHAVDCPLPEAGGDVNLGTVSLPEQRELLTVPIYLSWGNDVPEKQRVDFRVQLDPRKEGAPRFEVRTGSYDLESAAQRPEAWLMTARNVPPGEYQVVLSWRILGSTRTERSPKDGTSVPREEDGGFVELKRVDFVAGGAARKVHFLCGAARDASTGEVAFSRKPIPLERPTDLYHLRADGQGGVHLVWIDKRALYLRSGKDPRSAPQRRLWYSVSSDADAEGRYRGLEVIPGTSGDLHIVVLQAEGSTARFVRPEYWGLSAGGGSISGGVPLYQENSEADAFLSMSAPVLFPLSSTSADVICAATLPAGLAGPQMPPSHWAVGAVRGEKYTLKARIAFPRPEFESSLKGKVIGSSVSGVRILFAHEGDLLWAELKGFKLGLAAKGLGSEGFEKAAHVVAPKDTLILAMPVRVEDGTNRLWIGSGRVGGAIAVKAVLKEALFRPDYFTLAQDPKGGVYLFDVVRRDDGTHVVAHWSVGGKSVSDAVLTDHVVTSPGRLSAAMPQPGVAFVAWSEAAELRVERIDVEDSGRR